MIREHEVPAWHRFCIKVALLVVAVAWVSFKFCWVSHEQKRHSFPVNRAGHRIGFLEWAGCRNYVYQRGV